MLVAAISLRHAVGLFVQFHGWSHRVAGGALLAWLVFGVCSIPAAKKQSFWVFYDTILGLLGIAATITAARDFPHRFVQNAPGQSGTLAQNAIVTQSEMVEHCFYQGLNLFQAIYLHSMAYHAWKSPYVRLLSLWLVTLPWHSRNRFPVHSFSSNWTQQTLHKWNVELIFYRIKKWQYIFYKHAVFHGINISVALQPSNMVTTSTSWRIFWLALNTSYVMEFFLQSLVKRRMLIQYSMLWLQRLLMIASSIAAFGAVFPHLHIGVCIASVLLNFGNRGHDVFNTMALAALAMTVNTMTMRE